MTVEASVAQSQFSSLRPCGLGPSRLLCPWNSPGKNSGVPSQSLLLGIFLTQGLNPGLPHCRHLCHLSHQGAQLKEPREGDMGGKGGNSVSTCTSHTHSPSMSPSSVRGCSLMKQLLQNSKPDAFSETRSHAGRSRALDDCKCPPQFISLFQ